MARNKLLSTLILLPISKVYGWVMSLRNLMFNHDILLHEKKFDIPIITVGNIAMGGSGKTPHTEYIVESLKSDYKIGVLSRGYKRKTKGFILATKHSHPNDIGDEPYQIYHKFRKSGVVVAVCENRVEGIRQMREAYPDLNMIVLDDAFQHRYVKPTLSVMLMEFNRPAYEDDLLPYGHLREPMSALNRADIIVVSKCPDKPSALELRLIKSNLDLFPYQKLLFSKYIYQNPVPLFPDNVTDSEPLDLSTLTREDTLLIVCGVANPKPFVKYLRTFSAKIKIKRYADHHNFSASDMQSILDKYNAMPGKRKIVITTEKDGVRLIKNPYFPNRLRGVTYYVPIKVDFLGNNTEENLNTAIRQILRTNKPQQAN